MEIHKLYKMGDVMGVSLFLYGNLGRCSVRPVYKQQPTAELATPQLDYAKPRPR